MKGPSNGRITLLMLALAAALGLKVFDQPAATPTVAAAAPAADRTTRSPAQAQPEYPPAIRKRDLLEEGGFDLFALPPPPPSPAPAPVQRIAKPPSIRAAQTPPPMMPAHPVPPSTPPPPSFPYQAIGQYEVDGVRIVFLATPRGTVAAVEGQPIDPSWTVTSLRPDSMTVRHIASNFTTALALPTRQ